METAVLSAGEQFQRAQDAIRAAEDRIEVGSDRLHMLSARRDELMIENAIFHDKDDTITEVEEEIVAIQKDITDQERIIAALKGKLQHYEREARIEGKTQDAEQYRRAITGLQELFLGMPSLEAMTEAVEALERYANDLRARQKDFLSRGKALADFMASERLDTVGDVTMESLREDRAVFNYVGIMQLSEDILELSKRLNAVQFLLFDAGADSNPPRLAIPVIEDPDSQPDISPCGQYKRVRTLSKWELFKKETRLKPGGWGLESEDHWSKIATGLSKPNFPGPDGTVTWQESKAEPSKPIWAHAEVCVCKCHRRRFHAEDRVWYLEERMNKQDRNFGKLIGREMGIDKKPVFPCVERFKAYSENSDVDVPNEDET